MILRDSNTVAAIKALSCALLCEDAVKHELLLLRAALYCKLGWYDCAESDYREVEESGHLTQSGYTNYSILQYQQKQYEFYFVEVGLILIRFAGM